MWGAQSCYLKLINEQRALNCDSFVSYKGKMPPPNLYNLIKKEELVLFISVIKSLTEVTLRKRGFALDYSSWEGWQKHARGSHSMHRKAGGPHSVHTQESERENGYKNSVCPQWCTSSCKALPCLEIAEASQTVPPAGERASEHLGGGSRRSRSPKSSSIIPSSRTSWALGDSVSKQDRHAKKTWEEDLWIKKCQAKQGHSVISSGKINSV